jgi:hypothetical protein
MANRRLHAEEHARRARRLSSGVYGEVSLPVLPPGGCACDPLTFRASARTAREIAAQRSDGIDRRLDLRCFFTGVRCDDDPATGADRDARKLPWIGTRDHLVPARRDVPGAQPFAGRPALVWASNVANVTLGLAPLHVRLKVREWLSAAPYDRDDRSVEAGMNMRWLIIHYLDFFRVGGRYPWSRDADGRWWNPAFSAPFMARAMDMEARFLSLGDAGRDLWVRKFDWSF